MIAAILGTFLGVLVLLTAAMWVGVNTPEPAGHHHKPRRPTLWQGLRVFVLAAIWTGATRRERRQRERDRDEAYLRAVQEVRAEQHMETGPVTSSGMPLPPEVDDDWYDAQSPFRQLCPQCRASEHCEGGTSFCECACGLPDDPDGPIDPLAVLGDDACADALVGPARPRCRSGQGHDYDRCPGCDACRGCHPHDPGMGCLPWLAAVPVPRDDYADLAGGQYAEATGQFSVAVLDEYERALVGAVMPKDGA